MMLLVCVLLLLAAVPVGAQVVPFGVCAHLHRGDEYGEHEEELAMMEAAGIRWARSDFSWSAFEPQDDQWRFEAFDTVQEAARKHNVNILPILCYNVDWAFPAHEHLDEWCEYVRTVVTRYKEDLRYWEVWNEPNIAFWKPKPDPAQYTDLLTATYETIKEVDPELQVVYGGTAGVPLDYLRATFELGAYDAFDVLAVHPYQYPQTPEPSKLVQELRETWALMEEFGDRKPVWITEFGWPTHITPVSHDPSFLPQMVRYSAGLRFPERTEFAAAVLHVEGMPGCGAMGPIINERLNALVDTTSRLIGLEELEGLAPDEMQILVMPTGEHYPLDCLEAMVAFVRDGGLLVHLGGVPFYYGHRLVDGEWKQEGGGDGPRTSLHAGFKAWWTVEGLPEESKTTKLAAPEESGIVVPEKVTSKRWLTDDKLQGNDRFVPLLSAHEGDDLVGYPVGLYLYDSDLKGAFMGTILDIHPRGVSEDMQALYLPRAIMLALGEGLENVFWYEFRDGGNDESYNEHRFGAIHEDLSPKPAYQAYAAMAEALGEAKFVEKLDLGEGNWGYVFDAGDSKTAAVWRSTGTEMVALKVEGGKLRVTDYLGDAADVKPENGTVRIEASERVVYVGGVEAISAP